MGKRLRKQYVILWVLVVGFVVSIDVAAHYASDGLAFIGLGLLVTAFFWFRHVMAIRSIYRQGVWMELGRQDVRSGKVRPW